MLCIIRRASGWRIASRVCRFSTLRDDDLSFAQPAPVFQGENSAVDAFFGGRVPFTALGFRARLASNARAAGYECSTAIQARSADAVFTVPNHIHCTRV